MYVDLWWYIFLNITSGVGFLFLILIIWFLFEHYKEKKRLKEERLKNIEEDIRYLKGIGGVEK